VLIFSFHTQTGYISESLEGILFYTLTRQLQGMLLFAIVNRLSSGVVKWRRTQHQKVS